MLTTKAAIGFACLAFTSGLVLHQEVLVEGKQENWVGVDDGLGYCYEVNKNAGNEYLYGCIGGGASPCSQGSSTGMNVICKRGRGNCDSCSKRGFKNAGGDDTYPKPYGGKGHRGYVKFHVNELGRRNLAALKARPGVEDQWKFYAQMFPQCKLKAPKNPSSPKKAKAGTGYGKVFLGARCDCADWDACYDAAESKSMADCQDDCTAAGNDCAGAAVMSKVDGGEGKCILCTPEYKRPSADPLWQMASQVSGAFVPAITMAESGPVFDFVEGGCSRCAEVYIYQLNADGGWDTIFGVGAITSPFDWEADRHWEECNVWDGKSALKGIATIYNHEETDWEAHSESIHLENEGEPEVVVGYWGDTSTAKDD